MTRVRRANTNRTEPVGIAQAAASWRVPTTSRTSSRHPAAKRRICSRGKVVVSASGTGRSGACPMACTAFATSRCCPGW